MSSWLRRLFVLPATFLASTAPTCSVCRPAVDSGVYDGDFLKTLATLLLPLVIVGGVGAVIYRSDAKD